MTKDQKASLPAAVGTEVTVLGAMLLDAVAVMDATSMLRVTDFQVDSHRTIYRTILDLLQDNERVDLITVSEALTAAKQIDSVGGVAYLAYLTEGIPRNPNIESYVRIVREKSLLRQTFAICTNGAERARDGGESPQLIITDVEAKLAIARAEVVQEDTLEDQIGRTMESIRRQRTGEQKMYISSGLSVIDDNYTGFPLGETTVVAARSSVGKSTLLRQCALVTAKAGDFCHILSPEMRAELLLRLYASAESGVTFRRLKHPEWMSSAELADVEAALRDIASWPLKIDDTSPLTPADAIAKARIIKRKHNTKLLGVDYLQKLKFSGKVEHRYVQVTDAMVELTNFAKNERVAVLVISSITEPQGKDRNKAPTMADLRQSGDIQFEADNVILIHRERTPETQKHVPLAQFIFDKARSDDTGILEGYFDPEYVRFIDQQSFLSALGK